MANANDDLSKLSGDMYRQWEKSMTGWWDQVLAHPAFLQGTAKNLEANSAARKQWEDSVDQTMNQLHLPSRQDVVRLARIAGLLEDRLLGLEDKLLAQDDALARVEKETLRARVDAAEALIAVQDKLTAIEERLDRIAAAIAADRPARGRAAKE